MLLTTIHIYKMKEIKVYQINLHKQIVEFIHIHLTKFKKYNPRESEVRLCIIVFFEQLKYIYTEVDFESQILHFLDLIASKSKETETKQASSCTDSKCCLAPSSFLFRRQTWWFSNFYLSNWKTWNQIPL